MTEVVIERRFRGPPDSANGGYACGTLAGHVEGNPAVEVTLRAPPPLDTALQVEAVDSGAELRDGDAVVAEARPAPAPALDFPDPVSIGLAATARQNADLDQHPFPSCFVCGPGREKGDGLGIVSGPVSGRETELVAGPFATEEWMSEGEGNVRSEIVWSVLDCPSGIAVLVMPELEGPYVLGRLTAHIARPVEIGRTYAAIGWPVANEGRKFSGASAIFDPDVGEPLAWASALWIRVRDGGGE